MRFLEDTKIPYSNNAAESDITMVKLRQKISGGFRTEVGAQEFLTMRSVIQSCSKQGWRVIETLAHPHPLRVTETRAPACEPHSVISQSSCIRD